LFACADLAGPNPQPENIQRGRPQPKRKQKLGRKGTKVTNKETAKAVYWYIWMIDVRE
jgi:hypothetical protein